MIQLDLEGNPIKYRALKWQDRQYENNFYFDFKEKNYYYQSVSVSVIKTDRQEIKEFVFGRVKKICQKCGKLSQKQLVHQNWHYDLFNRTKEMRRLLCLCENCYRGIHGLPLDHPDYQRIKAHVMEQNHWSCEQYQQKYTEGVQFRKLKQMLKLKGITRLITGNHWRFTPLTLRNQPKGPYPSIASMNYLTIN